MTFSGDRGVIEVEPAKCGEGNERGDSVVLDGVAVEMKFLELGQGVQGVDGFVRRAVVVQAEPLLGRLCRQPVSGR